MNDCLSSDNKAVLSRYPKKRPALPDAYKNIYTQEYLINREGTSLFNKLAMTLEACMHRYVAQKQGPSTIELGAGTLNHLQYEPETTPYDIIEPFLALYENRPELSKIRTVYRSHEDVPFVNKYDRFISIAVLEHLEKLPEFIAKSALLLNPGGVFQAAFPCEGELAWYLAWRYGTGLGYKIRTGLDYAPLMRHEHINTLKEIRDVINIFFNKTTICRFPLPFPHFAFYAYMEAWQPDTKKAAQYLSL